MKRLYDKPRMDIMELDCEDIIRTSGGDNDGDSDGMPTDPVTTGMF